VLVFDDTRNWRKIKGSLLPRIADPIRASDRLLLPRHRVAFRSRFFQAHK
jgi:hypothetical protein